MSDNVVKLERPERVCFKCRKIVKCVRAGWGNVLVCPHCGNYKNLGHVGYRTAQHYCRG